MGFEDPTKEYNGKETSDYLMNIKTGEKFIRDKRLELNILEDTMNNVKDFIEITKPFYYGWKTAIKIGLYKDGELVSIGTVSSGLTDFYREDFAKNPQKYIGQVIECECMELKDGSLRHPIFKRFREDKNAEDCKYEEVFK